MSSYVVHLIDDIAIHNLPCTLEIFFIKTIAYPILVGYVPYYHVISL